MICLDHFFFKQFLGTIIAEQVSVFLPLMDEEDPTAYRACAILGV